jgi:hypothetical protein
MIFYTPETGSRIRQDSANVSVLSDADPRHCGHCKNLMRIFGYLVWGGGGKILGLIWYCIRPCSFQCEIFQFCQDVPVSKCKERILIVSAGGFVNADCFL